MESFLKEQLKRIQDLAEQMSSLERSAALMTSERSRHTEVVSHGPLADVRDFRTHSSGRLNRLADRADDAPPRRKRRR